MSAAGTITMTYREAAHRALAEEMAQDATVWALGEDLGRGGIFGQYAGLAERFGPDRIVDSPISESAIVGAAVGAAMAGTRPVAELRIADFALCAIDEMVNQAAKARYMFGGQARVPLVAREPIGIWPALAAQHSQSLEAWYTHIPGLVVTAPATPGDAWGLLRAAIRCDDPVVHLEHKMLWDLSGAVPADTATDTAAVPPIGVARTMRAGSDLTLVSWSRMVHVCAEAAEILEAEGVSAEVIDLRTLWPWDQDTVLTSAARTGRLLIVQEAVSVSGFGAEIAAVAGEHLFGRLKAPVRRLGAPRAPVPYSPPLEAGVHVTADAVLAAARALLS
jgi:pyruvate dehydrogenase E1 component beta subunit